MIPDRYIRAAALAIVELCGDDAMAAFRCLRSRATFVWGEKMIKRRDNPVMQFVVGPLSPVTWTVVFLLAICFWS